jgi:hypothetical protein
MAYTYQVRLSEHMAETPEHYLLCTDAILARSGAQQYKLSEIFEDSRSDELVDVDRPVSEVTSKQFLGSIPGKAVVIGHPSSGFLNPTTHAWSAVGTVLTARVGPEKDDDGNTLVLGDIVLHDPRAIEAVKGGLRQLSLGYTYDIAQSDDGGLEMQNLRTNHCALVSVGRAGNAEIVDARPVCPESFESMMRRYHRRNQPEARRAQDEDQNHLAALNDPQNTGENFHENEDTMKKAKDQDQPDDATVVNWRRVLIAALTPILGGAVVMALFKGSSEDASDGIVEGAELGRSLAHINEDDDLLPTEALPESERGENPVVDALKKLRPAIEGSGDRKAIDTFNRCMKAAKRGFVGPAERLIAADRRPSGPTFNDLVARRRSEMLGVRARDATGERRAEDREPGPASFEQSVARVRERMLNEKPRHY